MGQKTKLFAGIIFGIVVILLFMYLFTPTPYQPKDTTTFAAERSVVEEWKVYRSPSERFAVSLPAPPQRAIDSAPMPSSDERIRYDMYVSQGKRGTVFMVNIIDYPPSVDMGNSETVLMTAINGIVSGNQSNQLVKTNTMTFNGLPGVDFIISNPQAMLHGRAILKGSSLFVLSVADHDPQVADKDFQRLAESFVLMG